MSYIREIVTLLDRAHENFQVKEFIKIFIAVMIKTTYSVLLLLTIVSTKIRD